MVDVWLPYGKTEVCARIPMRNLQGIVEPAEKPAVSSPEDEVRRALNDPIGSRALNDLIEPDSSVAIVVDDSTRPAPSHLIVPPILSELNKSEVKDGNITVIFGCGSHRAVTQEEAVGLLGEGVVGRVKVLSHDCKAKDHVFVGKTQKHGTEVYLNCAFTAADVKILTGDICFHYYAGYGGGRKSVLPAIAGEDTIRKNHSLLLDPKARTGQLVGNPVHEDMVEAARLADVDFLVNVVTNKEGRIVKAFGGELEAAFNEGTKLVDEMYRKQVDQRADVVVVSPGGYPADKNVYQAYKGVDNALRVVKRGGVLVLVAECPEGHGNEVFYEWMAKSDFKKMERRIKRRFSLGGHKAYYLMKALQKAQIILVSSMPDHYASSAFKFKTARAVNDAIDKAFNIVGRRAKILVMPYGSYTLPGIGAGEDQ